jgi:hypothetical protein
VAWDLPVPLKPVRVFLVFLFESLIAGPLFLWPYEEAGTMQEMKNAAELVAETMWSFVDRPLTP